MLKELLDHLEAEIVSKLADAMTNATHTVLIIEHGAVNKLRDLLPAAKAQHEAMTARIDTHTDTVQQLSRCIEDCQGVLTYAGFLLNPVVAESTQPTATEAVTTEPVPATDPTVPPAQE